MGKLHVIKLHEKAAADVDYEVTVADIEEYEAKYGMIQENSIVSRPHRQNMSMVIHIIL